MLEIIGNIWDFHAAGEWIGITTNTEIRKDGKAVMGKGIALEAAEKFPDLPIKLASHIRQAGWRCRIFNEYKIITFPTKTCWREKSNIQMIETNAKELMWIIKTSLAFEKIDKIYLPRLGCGNGGLKWEDVRNTISSIFLWDNVIIVTPEKEIK